jgi:hypothetical protein
MTEFMDPDKVLEYADHLEARAVEEVRIQSWMISNDANQYASAQDMESGLHLMAEWFGPNTLWTSDVTDHLENIFMARAEESAAAESRIRELRSDLQLFVERWNKDEGLISDDLNELASELDD